MNDSTKRGMKSATDPSLFAPLGRAVNSFAMLERAVDSAIQHLLFGNTAANQRRADIVTERIPMRNKLEILSALVSHVWNAAPPPLFPGLLNRLRKANADRNMIAHSQWIGGYNGEPGMRIGRKLGGPEGIKYSRDEKTHAELEGYADDFEVLTMNVSLFIGTSGRRTRFANDAEIAAAGGSSEAANLLPQTPEESEILVPRRSAKRETANEEDDE